jgi:hypothetical protein
MPQPLFLSLDSAFLAREVEGAERSVWYAAPGILQPPPEALARLAERIGPELITVCPDFDERVMRMGFGTFDAVNMLRVADIEVCLTPGISSRRPRSIWNPTSDPTQPEREAPRAGPDHRSPRPTVAGGEGQAGVQ